MVDKTYKIIKTDGAHASFAGLCKSLNDELDTTLPERKGVRDSTVGLDQIGDVFLALDGGSAVGSMGLKHINPNMCELVRAYIQPEYRGKGLAKKLATCVLSLAQSKGYKHMSLVTIESPSHPVGFYKKLGFDTINDDGFATDSILDANTIYMIKNLNQAEL